MLLLNRTLIKMAKGLWGWDRWHSGTENGDPDGDSCICPDHLGLFGECRFAQPFLAAGKICNFFCLCGSFGHAAGRIAHGEGGIPLHCQGAAVTAHTDFFESAGAGCGQRGENRPSVRHYLFCGRRRVHADLLQQVSARSALLLAVRPSTCFSRCGRLLCLWQRCCLSSLWGCCR